jgi:hypothetical protein
MTRMLLLVCSLLLASCGDDEGDCVSKCEDAQARDCTSIRGDCGNFCSALFDVEEPSGCSDERVDYQDCLDEEGICSNDCGVLESSLSNCVGTYCLAHSGDSSCQVLMESF